MTIEDVEKGVERAWRLVAPPLIDVVILGLLVSFVAPALGQKCIHEVRALAIATSSWSGQRSLLEFLGLSKLIPVISLVVVVSALLLLQKVISAVGYFTPWRLKICSPANYAVAIGSDRLLGLWRWFPLAEGLFDLAAAAESRFNAVPPELKTSHAHWRAAEASAIQLYYIAKFYILAVLLLSISELTAGGSIRWLAAVSWLLVAGTVAGCSLYNALNAHLQAICAVVNAVEAELLVQVNAPSEATPEVQEEREGAVSGCKSAGWWELEWFILPAWRHVRILWASRRRVTGDP